jgi:hypothetical protein
MRAIAASKAGDVQDAMAANSASGEANAAEPNGNSAAEQDFANYLDAKQPGNGGQDVTAGKAPAKPDDQNAKAADAPQAAVAIISAAPRKLSPPEKKTSSKESAPVSATPEQQAMAIDPLVAQVPVQPAPQAAVKAGTARADATSGNALGPVQGGSRSILANGSVAVPAAVQPSAASPANVAGQASVGSQVNVAGQANVALQVNVALRANVMAQGANEVTTTTAAAGIAEQTAPSNLAAAGQASALGGEISSAAQDAPQGQAPISPTGRGKGVPAWAAARAAQAGAAEIAGADGKSGAKVDASGDGKGRAADNEELASNGTSGALQGQPMAATAQMQQSKTPFQIGGGMRSTAETASAASSANATTTATPTSKALPVQISLRQATVSTPQPATAAGNFSLASTATASTDKTSTASAASDASARQQALTAATLSRVMDTAATMRTSSQNRVEMQLKLDDGQEITVRLQMTQGVVRPIFKTESTELRQALEQGWAGFRSAASEKGLDIARPVFESAGSESGFGSFGSREQSGQAGGEIYEAEETLPGQPAAKASTNPTVTTVPSTTGSAVQLYA